MCSLRHVLQEFIHFLGSSCLLSGSQSERPSTAGLTVGQLVANLWKNMIQTRDRMDDVKSQVLKVNEIFSCLMMTPVEVCLLIKLA